MANKKKKSKKKRSRFGGSLIVVVLIVSILTTFGYIGKKSIEKGAPQEDILTTEQSSDITENEVTNAPSNNTEPKKITPVKGTVVKDNAKDKQTEEKTEKPKESTKKVTYAKDASIKKLLQNALKPMGTTMYIYGGGWNNADTGASSTTTTLGLHQQWKNFYGAQDESYNHKNHSNRADGLDSSGYIGWVLYNTLMTKNGESGFVFSGKSYDEKLEELGLGKRTPKSDVTIHRAGDIMSSEADNFAYIVIGECSDGSVVCALSSPPGVRLCGTPAKDGTQDSEAVILAEQYMNDYFGDWYKKFPDCSKGMAYLTNYDKFSPDKTGAIKDNEGLRSLNAQDVLNAILN
ncbi:MAG: hypothetical protein IKV64_05310 [Clostridia bacterium]|nr:hypothetical protein [Clostridia bacterium]